MGSGAWFSGNIDDVSIWNVPRSNASIQADMAQPPTTPQSGLVADYQLNDGSGLTAADASGNNRTASLGGGTAANAPAWVTSNAPINGVVSTSTATTQTAIDHFAVVFSQALQSSSATNASNYGLTDSSGHTYQLTPSYTSKRRQPSIPPLPQEPLQPGLTYTFQTLAGLNDVNGSSVTPFSMQFTVSNPADGQIALTTHGTRFVPGATPLPMTQVSTGFSTALGVGTLANTSDPNYWYFNANAGDQITVRVEAQALNNNIVPAARPRGRERQYHHQCGREQLRHRGAGRLHNHQAGNLLPRCLQQQQRRLLPDARGSVRGGRRSTARRHA